MFLSVGLASSVAMWMLTARSFSTACERQGGIFEKPCVSRPGAGLAKCKHIPSSSHGETVNQGQPLQRLDAGKVRRRWLSFESSCVGTVSHRRFVQESAGIRMWVWCFYSLNIGNVSSVWSFESQDTGTGSLNSAPSSSIFAFFVFPSQKWAFMCIYLGEQLKAEALWAFILCRTDDRWKCSFQVSTSKSLVFFKWPFCCSR